MQRSHGERIYTSGALVRAADPAGLQREAIAKIEAVTDHFRKTFDYTSRMADLADAERHLRASVEGFDGRRDLANVALSLIRLGQIQRMQGKWDAAGRYYEQAESAARKANHPADQAKEKRVTTQQKGGCFV